MNLMTHHDQQLGNNIFTVYILHQQEVLQYNHAFLQSMLDWVYSSPESLRSKEPKLAQLSANNFGIILKQMALSKSSSSSASTSSSNKQYPLLNSIYFDFKNLKELYKDKRRDDVLIIINRKSNSSSSATTPTNAASNPSGSNSNAQQLRSSFVINKLIPKSYFIYVLKFKDGAQRLPLAIQTIDKVLKEYNLFELKNKLGPINYNKLLNKSMILQQNSANRPNSSSNIPTAATAAMAMPMAATVTPTIINASTPPLATPMLKKHIDANMSTPKNGIVKIVRLSSGLPPTKPSPPTIIKPTPQQNPSLIHSSNSFTIHNLNNNKISNTDDETIGRSLFMKSSNSNTPINTTTTTSTTNDYFPFNRYNLHAKSKVAEATHQQQQQLENESLGKSIKGKKFVKKLLEELDMLKSEVETLRLQQDEILGKTDSSKNLSQIKHTDTKYDKQEHDDVLNVSLNESSSSSSSSKQLLLNEYSSLSKSVSLSLTPKVSNINESFENLQKRLIEQNNEKLKHQQQQQQQQQQTQQELSSSSSIKSLPILMEPRTSLRHSSTSDDIYYLDKDAIMKDISNQLSSAIKTSIETQQQQQQQQPIRSKIPPPTIYTSSNTATTTTTTTSQHIPFTNYQSLPQHIPPPMLQQPTVSSNQPQIISRIPIPLHSYQTNNSNSRPRRRTFANMIWPMDAEEERVLKSNSPQPIPEVIVEQVKNIKGILKRNSSDYGSVAYGSPIGANASPLSFSKSMSGMFQRKKVDFQSDVK